LLTMLPMQIVPAIAGRAGWRWAFVILALGPVAGIAAIKRLAAMRKISVDAAALSATD
jgi:hypothetical protein